MKDEVLKLLQKVIGNYHEFSNNEYYFVCPLCTKNDGKKKLAIKINPDDIGDINWHCWRDGSHRGKSLQQLFKQLGNTDALATYNQLVGNKHMSYDVNNLHTMFNLFDKKEAPKERVYLPKEYIRLYDCEPSFYSKQALQYLTKTRKGKLSEYDIVKYNIGFCDTGAYAGYIIIPSYDSSGLLDYFVARSFLGAYKRYKNPHVEKSNVIFNDIHINWNLPVVLCEGVFDAIAIKRNAIPVLGNTISQKLKQKILSNESTVYIALDSDMINQSIKIIEEFIQAGLDVYYVELDEKDPSDTNFEEIIKKINNATLMTMQSFIKMKINNSSQLPIKRKYI